MEALRKIGGTSKRKAVHVESISELAQELKRFLGMHPRACQLDVSVTPGSNPRRLFTFQFSTPMGVRKFGLHGDTKRAAIEKFVELAAKARKFEDVLTLAPTKGKNYKVVLHCAGGDELGWYSYSPIPKAD
ncbi:MAG: hypothetical protein ACT4TC_16630 [Myxococcaceae bacterium]